MTEGRQKLKILIVTACTGQKAITHDNALSLDDFLKDSGHIAKREKELSAFLTPATSLYTGQQHVRLMQGIRHIQQSEHADTLQIDLWILSAGYGLIPGNKTIAPYECTFQGMKKPMLMKLAAARKIPADFRKVTSRPFDLGLILLGDSYLKACAPDADIRPGGPMLCLCGKRWAGKLTEIPDLKPVILSNPEARRFSCGLVGLKGDITARLLAGITQNGITQNRSFIQQVTDPETNVLDILDSGPADQGTERISRRSFTRRANPAVDQVIEIPAVWQEQSNHKKIKYFIPDWDDQVDPEYDFDTDTHWGGAGDWSNQVYAHQMYPAPCYDGILISKIVAEQSKKKKERINRLGVHRHLRLPGTFPVMGDCGAFGYIKEDTPPYTTHEILDYYTRLGFDYGVSIDHLIITGSEEQKRFRYALTIQNAEDFIREHQKMGLAWEPMGAVQGWDGQSYQQAAAQYVKMGYRYLALGGLVRTRTEEILTILEKVREVVPEHVKIHLFGLARLNAISEFLRFKIYSMDSASVLRKAWLGSDQNFLTETGWYSAIRVPQSDKSFRAKRLLASGKNPEDLAALEKDCLCGLREYAGAEKAPPESLISCLVEYDSLIAGERKGTEERIIRTLQDRPWEKCGCAICKKWGIEVAVFRGNNRNRRRGFHNTHVFYRLLERLLAGENIPWLKAFGGGNGNQLRLF